MKFLQFFLVIIMMTICTWDAEAADPKDVQKVVELIHNKETKGLVFWKPIDEGVEVVFIQGGKRYTMYHSGFGSINLLSVWVRPDGTSDDKILLTFTDDDLDGKIDFGINGKDGDEEIRQYFKSKKMYSPDKEEGTRFKEFWQAQYDAAIKAALKRLK